MKELETTLKQLAAAAAIAAPALPGVGAPIGRIIAAALSAAAALVAAGVTSTDELVARIQRVGRIDTREEDAELDAKIAALPSRESAAHQSAVLEQLLEGHVAKTTLTERERLALAKGARALRALERGELVSAIPVVLQPSHVDD